jgi:hypothetical protein
MSVEISPRIQRQELTTTQDPLVGFRAQEPSGHAEAYGEGRRNGGRKRCKEKWRVGEGWEFALTLIIII